MTDKDGYVETPNETFHREVTRWFSDNGDLTHRINYDLNSKSIIVDIGGFQGDWASNIFSKYLCNISVFEQVKSYYDFIKDRFKRNRKINVFNYGFGKSNEILDIIVSAESSSLYIPLDNHVKESIELKSFNEFLNNIEHIDLVKINIEGSEYDLLESIDDDNIKKLLNIQVQFHTFVSNCEQRRNVIRERLSLTHECTYCYDFVWENWKLKNTN